MKLPWLDPTAPKFPSTEFALDEPPGLLAAGGNLEVKTLLDAYYHGIFPWYSEGEPPLWWAPEDRAVLYPEQLHISRSNRKLINKHEFKITSNACFDRVIQQCSDSRETETWILPEMIQAYINLHRAGAAHSVEVWLDDVLVGGLYGIQVGSIFCGESMFNNVSNTSKIAFIYLCKILFSKGFTLIDCQLANPFLESLGVGEIDRSDFEEELITARDTPLGWPSTWNLTALEIINE